MIMCVQTLISFGLFFHKILSNNLILTSIEHNNYVANLQNPTFYNFNADLVTTNVYTKFGSYSPFIFKILSKPRILTSTKGHYSVTNLQNLSHCSHKVDHVNDNVYTKFGLIQSNHSQDIERKPNYAGMSIAE